MGRVAVLVVAFLVGAGTARAQPSDDGAKLFEKGRTLAKAGKYAEACEVFKESYAIDRAAGTALNIGDCLEHLGQLRRAWQSYEEAAAAYDKAGDDRVKFARERARAVRGKLGQVIVQVEGPAADGLVIKLDGESVPPQAKIKEYFDPGTVEVTAKVPGKDEFSSSAKVVVGRSVIVDVPAFDGEVHARPHRPDEPPPVHGGRRDPGRVKLAIGLGAGGGVALVTAGVLALTARSSYNSALDDKLCVKKPDGLLCTQAGADQVSSAATRANVATAFAIGGVVLAGAAAVLYFTAPRLEDKGVAITPMVDSSSVGLAVGGSF